MKDNFSKQAEVYAKHRPVYPPELFEFILGRVKEKNLAWDCGTGNGQTAAELSKHFEKVIATDISSSQIENATKAHNVTYQVEPAEQTSIQNNSVDLITVSQALHWFGFDKFYEEVKRVAKPGAIIAAWTYNLLQTDPVTDKIIRHYHFETLKEYWDKERTFVDNEYTTIPFPFKTLDAPQFFIKLNWNIEQLEGYLNTWSALQKFIKVNNYNPVDELIEKIKENWRVSEIRPIVFPVHLKIANVW